MKHSLKITLFVLLLCGVFGADEVKSVMEGDSVTLTPDPAKIQGFSKIQWRFGNTRIAQIKGTESSTENEDIFRDRLKLDHQTGSLTIRNMRIIQSGLYQLQIDNRNTGLSYIQFNVTVKESPSVIAEGEAESKLMSVTAGDPVTLHVPQIQGDELIVWRFGDEGKLIAKADIEAKSSSLYDETDERFRDRLKLDQTGSLTITNTSTTDSGLYTAKISSNKQTLYKRFTVTVSERGFSGGVVAGIVIGVLLLAVAVAGVIYYFLRPITNKLPNQTWSVPVRDNITLNPEPEIQTGDEIQWLFGDEDTLIAEIKGENREMKTYDGPDERFENILKLDETTGSLTITHISEHSGLYTLKIRRGRETFYKRFNVSVSERMITVTEGDPVFLYPDTKIQKDDEVQWLFGDKEQTVQTEIKNTEVTKYTGTDWRFRDRLKLNEEKGKLIFTNITAAHEGYYTLKITRGRDKIYERFNISVTERKITVMEGYPVTLKPAYEIKKDDVIHWLFGDREYQTVIAEFNVKTGEISRHADVALGRFRDRLELDETTGSLTINNTKTTHTGVYKLEIISSRGVTKQTITVTVNCSVLKKEAREKLVMKEKTDDTENRVNESVTVEMEKKPLLNGEDVNVVNEERTSSL
ncbi:uncharacterized protein LOC127988118 [Carassius gibelio]|uniref:uncharacterized protein LOC127988118 n=1 Tax=Carassius gibelio TaxID=101364 RepID=UPI0022774DE8|nr:uncharacterized protein LOC127988118 [Carassius gibelio]